MLHLDGLPAPPRAPERNALEREHRGAEPRVGDARKERVVCADEDQLLGHDREQAFRPLELTARFLAQEARVRAGGVGELLGFGVGDELGIGGVGGGEAEGGGGGAGELEGDACLHVPQHRYLPQPPPNPMQPAPRSHSRCAQRVLSEQRT
eukprot:961428-Rhodomonas_salina.1